MDRAVTACGPASAPLYKIGVRHLSNHKIARRNVRALHLHMAFETEVIVTFHEQLPVHRTMRVVAGGATLAQGLVLEYERAALLSMTLGATFVQARHRQTAGGLHNVMAMRIVALHAIHAAFNDRMMLR